MTPEELKDYLFNMDSLFQKNPSSKQKQLHWRDPATGHMYVLFLGGSSTAFPLLVAGNGQNWIIKTTDPDGAIAAIIRTILENKM